MALFCLQLSNLSSSVISIKSLYAGLSIWQNVALSLVGSLARLTDHQVLYTQASLLVSGIIAMYFDYKSQKEGNCSTEVPFATGQIWPGDLLSA